MCRLLYKFNLNWSSLSLYKHCNPFHWRFIQYPMVKSDFLLTPYQIFILPCITLIFWSLFLIVFRIDGSGRWNVDIDWLILNSKRDSNVTWFVFNETKELCSCFTKFFNECDLKKIKGDKNYTCTCPTRFGRGQITYCNKSNYYEDMLEYEEETIDLYVLSNKNNCQHYGGYSKLTDKKPQQPCPFCYEILGFIHLNSLKIMRSTSMSNTFADIDFRLTT
ncbi:unnamed protein product [Schistosoma guineensis]|nr:unnamed protein product [Schistosoma guineensis]